MASGSIYDNKKVLVGEIYHINCNLIYKVSQDAFEVKLNKKSMLSWNTRKIVTILYNLM